jgi:hypothetical protein
MTYAVTAYNVAGERIASLGRFGNVASARQAMLDHANIVDLPTEDPWHGQEIGLIEGWFVGHTEYLIEQSSPAILMANPGDNPRQ